SMSGFKPIHPARAPPTASPVYPAVKVDTPSSKRRRNISVACQACRQHRRKVCPSLCPAYYSSSPGGQPCVNCRVQNLDCVIAAHLDGRRKERLKRRIQELESVNEVFTELVRTIRQKPHSKADTLNILIDFIRNSNDQSLEEGIRLIRENGSLKDITQHARIILTCHRETSRSSAGIRHDIMSISSLTNTPPLQLPAQPWTNVTTDDVAVSHLISTYLAWQYHQYPSLIPNIFLRAMKAKDLSSQLCSPLLVNAILAIAC
ncbi:hypothetical protein A1O7_07620, partial [Cladophialophora yegresii CBS 114405]